MNNTLENSQPIISDPISFEPLPGKVSVWNVKSGQCRWVDDEGFFCADPTAAPTKSYCPAHQQRCFIPNVRKAKPSCSYQPRVLENFV